MVDGRFFLKALIYLLLEFAGGAAAAGAFKVTHEVKTALFEGKIEA